MARGIGNLYVSLGLNSTPFIGSLGDAIKKLDEFKARNGDMGKSLKDTGKGMKDTGDASKYLVAQLKDMDNVVGKVSGSFEHFKGAIEATAVGLLAIKGLETAFDFLKDAVKEAAAEEVGMRKVADVISATGGAAGKTAEDVEKMAAKFMESSTYSKDSIMDMEAKLLTFRKVSGDTFTRASRDVLDMAYVMGEEPAKAAIQLGKALNDPIAGITALKKAGVTFSESQKEVIKSLIETGEMAKAQNIILTELENEFGGAAAGAADTFSGKLIVLKNLWGETKEQVGAAFVQSGSMDELLKSMKQSVLDLTDWIGKNKTQFQQWVKDGILVSVNGLMGLNVVIGAVAVILQELGGFIEINWGLLQGLGGWALRAGSAMESAFSGVLDFLIPIVGALDQVINGLAKVAGKEQSSNMAGAIQDLKIKTDGLKESTHKMAEEWVKMGAKTSMEGIKMMGGAGGTVAAFASVGSQLLSVRDRIEKGPISVDNSKSTTTPHDTSGDSGSSVSKETVDKYASLIEQLNQAVGKINPYSEAIVRYNSDIDKLNKAWETGQMSVQTYNDYIDKLNAVFDKTAKKLLDDLDAQLSRPVDKYGKAKENYASAVEKIDSYVTSGLIDPSLKDSYMSSAQGMYDAEVAKIQVKEDMDRQKSIEAGIKDMGKAMNEAGIKIKGFDQFSGAYKTLSDLGNKIKTGELSADSSTAQLMQIQGYAQLASGIGQAIGGKVGSVISSTAGMAASGATIATALGATGPIGAVVGGVVGLVSSLFGGDNGKAQRDDARRQAYGNIVQSALSGGTYSSMILKNGGYTYEGVANEHVAGDSRDRLLSDRAEAGVADLQNRISVLDQAGKTIGEMMTPTELQNLANAKTLLDYTIATVGNLSEATTAYWDGIIKDVTGITADSVGSMVSKALDISTSAEQAGRTFTETFEAQVVKGIKDMAISDAIQQAIMPILSPMMTTLVQGMIGGTLTTDQMASMVTQVKDVAESVAPIVSMLYDSFNSAGLNTSFTAATDASAPVTLEARASGGSIVAGRSYIVGEHRPEVFTAGANGFITPYVPQGGADYSGFLQELKSILAASQNTTITIDGQQFSAYLEKKRIQAESKIASGLSRTSKQVF